jgi:hypothetical protein
MNTTPPVRVERRAGQRFPFLLPLTVRQVSTALEAPGFTQDLSSRGVFFFTDMPLPEGAEVEITLRMPSEITLGESMPVRCRGRVLRVAKPAAGASPAVGAETKNGIAVRLDSYEYLTEAKESSAGYARLSALHPQPEAEDDSSSERRRNGDTDRPALLASPRS